MGAAIARSLAAEGAKVAVAARPGPKLDAVADDVGGVGIGVDLATEGGPSAAVESAVSALGGLDLLLVNMGGPPPGRFDDLSDEDWQNALDMTFWSTIRLVRLALPHSFARATAARS